MAWVTARPAVNLGVAGLQPGDILIHHRHGLNGAWELMAFHCSIVGFPDQGMATVIDSLPAQGVRRKPTVLITDGCVVFRPIIPPGVADVANAAATRAMMMVAATTQYGDHGITRAAGGLFVSSSFGAGAQTRLNKYHAKASGSPKNAYCSELVILCYQLGCMDLNLHHGAAHFPNRDAKFTTPWDLEAYLLKHHQAWQNVGACP
jgi:hypothetical protein